MLGCRKKVLLLKRLPYKKLNIHQYLPSVVAASAAYRFVPSTCDKTSILRSNVPDIPIVVYSARPTIEK